jgi:hypothetical protein
MTIKGDPLTSAYFQDRLIVVKMSVGALSKQDLQAQLSLQPLRRSAIEPGYLVSGI